MVPKLAQQRARDHYSWNGSPADVVVIGDSTRDIHAARAAGVRVIAVATGRTPLNQLSQADPATYCRTSPIPAPY